VRLTRIHAAFDLRPDNRIELPPEAATHVARVLRARSGDALVLFDGRGGEFDAVIDSIKGTRVAVSVGSHRAVERESPLAIQLIQCIPRGDRMDLIVQKAVELGVTHIAPVMSQRSVVRLDKAQAESKSAHWRGVAVSACEQCGRNRIPTLADARPLLDHLGALPLAGGDIRWVLEPDEASVSVARPQRINSPAGIHIAVGPEGGFAPDELEAFGVAGFGAMRLGPRILRSETAAIAALAWLQSSYGDM
jgi:16S rRNA (uracil1498-N3)-methyltransferase